MKFRLFVSDSFVRCREAERVWKRATQETGVELSIVDINSDDGHALAKKMGISIVPVVTVDDYILSIGVPTMEEVRGLLSKF